MTKYVCNALSGQMLTRLSKFHLDGIEISEEFFYNMTRDAKSFMGHHDVADKFNLEYNRGNIYLKDGDVLYVAQNDAGRLKENETIKDINNVPLKYYQILVGEK